MILRLEDPQHLCEMLVASHHDDVYHCGFAAFFGRQCSVQILSVLAHEVDTKLIIFRHALLLQREQNGSSELVFLELRLHALFQAVVISLVTESVFDLYDLAIGTTHETLD